MNSNTCSLIKSLGAVFLLSLTPLQTKASGEPPAALDKTLNKNMISCTMKDGAYVHSLLKVSDGYKAYVNFASYKKDPSQEILDRNKELYAQGIFPPDPRTHAIAVPVGDSNYLSSNEGTLLKRINFLESLYPKVPVGENFPPNFGALKLDFSEKGCLIHEADGLMSARCETSSSKIMNGLKVDRIILQMSNTKTLRLVDDLSKADGMVARAQNIVTASVTFLHKNKYYRSSFTYKPNGDDSPCYVRKINLPKYDDQL